MLSTYKQLKQCVTDVIGESTTTKILSFIKLNRNEVWGTSQPLRAHLAIVLITIYKDIYGVGYDAL